MFSRALSAATAVVTFAVAAPAAAQALTTETSIQRNAITSDDTWTLSDAGKTLTLARSAATPMGQIERKMVYHTKS